MAPKANFESISYNTFTVIDNVFNSESNPDISFYRDIFSLDTDYFNSNKVCKAFKCLCKNNLSVLHVSIRSINKNFETLKHFYSTLDCMFTIIFFFRHGLLTTRFVMIQIFT